eukprot:TRINITY_DN1654_c1_g1_i1.p1 TRINITY_DN1654_c1_g1~~TRINITY_DN1654_c1_g1_i1.p1  ORF type:complete len:102 (-),score=5.71 TRINITY_DN1654_c1_g1_i1:829-1134(-)
MGPYASTLLSPSYGLPAPERSAFISPHLAVISHRTCAFTSPLFLFTCLGLRSLIGLGLPLYISTRSHHLPTLHVLLSALPLDLSSSGLRSKLGNLPFRLPP